MALKTAQMPNSPISLVAPKLPLILRSFIIALLLGVQLGCTATTLPPYEATYTTKLRGIKVNGTRKFESTTKDRYKVSWKAKALWMRLNEWSEFELIDGKQIRPISYHYTRKGLGTDKPIHIVFDWENMHVNASKGDKKARVGIAHRLGGVTELIHSGRASMKGSVKTQAPKMTVDIFVELKVSVALGGHGKEPGGSRENKNIKI
ncbi:MAG: hypothetical protein HOH29_08245, partial [Cellvibrionales bacterium]|nr:hypothetical protein [Cellvibrionales bacterium]